MKTSKNSVFKTEQFDFKRLVEILSKGTVCFFSSSKNNVAMKVEVSRSFCGASTCQSLLKLFSLTGLKTVFFIKAEVTDNKHNNG